MGKLGIFGVMSFGDKDMFEWPYACMHAFMWLVMNVVVATSQLFI